MAGFNAVIKGMNSDHVSDVRQAVKFAGSELKGAHILCFFMLKLITIHIYLGSRKCFITQGRSLINKIKRSGPRWLPCGIPDVTRSIQEK